MWDFTLVTNGVNFSSRYIYILRDFTALVNGLKSSSMYTDADRGVKSYSMQTVLVTYYAFIELPLWGDNFKSDHLGRQLSIRRKLCLQFMLKENVLLKDIKRQETNLWSHTEEKKQNVAKHCSLPRVDLHKFFYECVTKESFLCHVLFLMPRAYALQGSFNLDRQETVCKDRNFFFSQIGNSPKVAFLKEQNLVLSC